MLAAIAYVANPFVINAAAWDFHEIVLVPMIMAGVCWAVATKQMIWVWVFSVLLIATKEHYGVAVAAIGLLWWREHGERKPAAALAAFGLLALVLVIFCIMPYFNPGKAPAMFSADSSI